MVREDVAVFRKLGKIGKSERGFGTFIWKMWNMQKNLDKPSNSSRNRIFRRSSFLGKIFGQNGYDERGFENFLNLTQGVRLHEICSWGIRLFFKLLESIKNSCIIWFGKYISIAKNVSENNLERG